MPFHFLKKAIDGKGIDRHLMGLKLIAIENGIDIPNFYRDPAYSTSNNWRCSTSQVNFHFKRLLELELECKPGI